jgi:hypothetical protein
MNFTGIVSVGLAISLAANVFFSWRVTDLRADLQTAREKTAAASTAAKVCSTAVQDLSANAERQAKQAAAAIASARRDAQDAGRRADAERNRAPAVPGNSCASAEVETRDWLQARRAGQ